MANVTVNYYADTCTPLTIHAYLEPGETMKDFSSGDPSAVIYGDPDFGSYITVEFHADGGISQAERNAWKAEVNPPTVDFNVNL